MITRRAHRIGLILIIALLCAGYGPCGGDTRPQTPRLRLAKATDTYAQSIGSVFSIVQELHAAGKLTDATARDYTLKLREANRLGEQGRQLAVDYFLTNPDATDLPTSLKLDLKTLLDKADDALRALGNATDNNLLRALAEVTDAANNLRKLLL